MKTLFYACALVLAGCGPSAEEKAEAAIAKEFNSLIAPPRHYKPIELRKIKPPMKEATRLGELWYANHWELTDSAGIKTERVDTVAVKSDGAVLFY